MDISTDILMCGYEWYAPTGTSPWSEPEAVYAHFTNSFKKQIGFDFSYERRTTLSNGFFISVETEFCIYERKTIRKRDKKQRNIIL